MDAINNKVDNNGGNAQGIYAAGESNQVTSEILKVITAAGQTPSASVVDQLMAGLDKFVTGFGFWCTDTGSGGSYVIANQNSSFTRIPGLYVGLTLKFRPNSNNISATPNLTYRGTTYPIVGEETPLNTNDISTLRDCEIRFNGITFVVLQRSIARQIANFLPRGYIDGLELSWTSGAIVTIGIGECTAQNVSVPADSNRINAKLLSTLAKQTASWVAGSGGGLGTGVTATANTWLRVFIIAGPTLVDAGFDTSTSAANLLNAAGSAYTHYRQIGWVRIDNGGSIRQFQTSASDPNHVVWNETAFEATSYTGITPTGRHAITTADAPPGSDAYLTGFCYYNSSDNAAVWWILLSNGTSTATEPANGNYTYTSSSVGVNVNGFDGRFVDEKVTLDGSGRYYVSQRNTRTPALTLAQFNAFVTGYSWKR